MKALQTHSFSLSVLSPKKLAAISHATSLLGCAQLSKDSHVFFIDKMCSKVPMSEPLILFCAIWWKEPKLFSFYYFLFSKQVWVECFLFLFVCFGVGLFCWCLVGFVVGLLWWCFVVACLFVFPQMHSFWMPNLLYPRLPCICLSPMHLIFLRGTFIEMQFEDLRY